MHELSFLINLDRNYLLEMVWLCCIYFVYKLLLKHWICYGKNIVYVPLRDIHVYVSDVFLLIQVCSCTLFKVDNYKFSHLNGNSIVLWKSVASSNKNTMNRCISTILAPLLKLGDTYWFWPIRPLVRRHILVDIGLQSISYEIFR